MTWKDRYKVDIPSEDLENEGFVCSERIYYKTLYRGSYTCVNSMKKCEKCIKLTKKRRDSKCWNKYYSFKSKLKGNYSYEDWFLMVFIFICIVLFGGLFILSVTGVIGVDVPSVAENVTNVTKNVTGVL